MPRKTKHQKILAELRSLKSLVVTTPEKINPLYQEKKEVISKENLTSLLRTQTVTPGLTLDYSYIYQDLKKVAILATLALLIEVVVSLTLNLGFANLLKDLLK